MQSYVRLILVLGVLLIGISSYSSEAQTVTARAYPQAQISASGYYWFQVGAWAESSHGYASRFGIPVTGASVEIRVLSNQILKHRDSDAAYWIGINLPNDAFIQVGYLVDREDSGGQASWFWEYFPPGTADEGTSGFLGKIGSPIGPNGTWVKFSITSSNTTWSAYVNGQQVGSADLGLSSSRIGPYASAEVAQVREADNLLGPVEFRNLSYRDLDLSWHQAERAVALCCYSSGSARLQGPSYPYGIAGIPGENNHWLAGSNLPYKAEGQHIWPWLKVNVDSAYGTPSGSGLYVYGDTVTPIAVTDYAVRQNERYHLTGWSSNGGIPSDKTEFEVTKNLNLTATYAHQFFVSVTSPLGKSTGSGWYDEGSQASLSVTPSSANAPGVLGELGVRAVFAYWTGDYSGSAVKSTFVVDSPKTIQAVWSYDYTTVLFIFALLLAGTVTAVFLLHRQGWLPVRASRKSRLRRTARRGRGTAKRSPQRRRRRASRL